MVRVSNQEEVMGWREAKAECIGGREVDRCGMDDFPKLDQSKS